MGKRALLLTAIMTIAVLVTGKPADAADLEQEVRQAFVDCELLAPVTGTVLTEPPSTNPGTCMTPVIDDLYTEYPLTDVIKAFAGIYASESIPLYHCHSMFHQLGRAAVDQALQQDLRLGSLWNNCGSGFMHGLFENMALPPEPEEAGRTAAGSCAAQEFAENHVDFVSCIHSVGHAIYKTFADVVPGEQACRTVAATQGGSYQQEYLQECYGGLYMNDAETRIDLENPQLPEAAGEWEARFPVCGQVASPVQCAINYSLYAVRGNDKTAESFLQWCQGFESGDPLCLRRVAFDLSTLAIVEASEEPSILCYRLAEEQGAGAEVCRDAFLHASSEAGGGQTLAESCAAASEAGTSCAESSRGTGVLLLAVLCIGAGTLGLVALRLTGRRRTGRSSEQAVSGTGL